MARIFVRAGNVCGDGSQDGPCTACDSKSGNTIDGCQAEYVPEPDAMATLAAVPDHLSDERLLIRPDLMSNVGPCRPPALRQGSTVVQQGGRN